MSGFGSAHLPTAGDIIDGKYKLDRVIGQGGMGAVYAAHHLKLGHAVAIKVMLADSSNHEAATRFVNEGRAAANIQNEHVVRVSDVDEEHGYAYMVLELLEGEDLGQVLDREQRLPFHVAVGYVLQALDGVKQAHAQGIVHRDLKPSNLFLARRQDGSVVVKVLDFGISKANSSAAALGAAPGQLTSTKAMLGSPLYMSPEQLRSSKSVDARADIWAIGIILFELITGTLPYSGENLGELFAAILENDAPPLRALVPNVPAGLEEIVIRCLQRRPENRFQSVVELERCLLPFSSTPSTTGSPFAFSAIAPSSQLVSSRRAPSAPELTMPRSGPDPSGAAATGGPMSGHAHNVAPPLFVVGQTVPLGAMTPMPQRQTGNTWQSTSSSGVGPAPGGSRVGAFVGLGCALLAVIVVGLAGVGVYKRGKAASGASASASTSAPPAVITSDVPSATVDTAAPATTSSAVAVASAPASAMTAVAAPAGAGPASPRHHGPGPAAKPPETKPDTPKPMVQPPVAQPTPAQPPVPPPPSDGTLQTGR